MAAKKAPTKKMTLKKAPKAKKIVVYPYHVRIGTRNELGPERTFSTESAARKAIIDELKSFEPWCRRHNSKGIDAIEATKAKVGSITFNRKTNRIECCFDEMYGMWIAVEFWTTR